MQKTRLTLVIALVAVFAIISSAFPVLADDLTNNVLTQGGHKTVEITAGNAATVNFWLVATDNDGKTGCNVSNANHERAEVTLSLPTGVTAFSTSNQWTAPNKFDLRGCGTGSGVSVSFTSSTVGTHTITATIQGRSGVTGSFTTSQATFRLKVNSATPADTTPPTLHLPADIVEEATSAAGATVTYTVTATDDTDPNPTVVCTPALGSTFPITQTTVSCTAADAAGNTSTGSFKVTVADTTAPTLHLSTDLTEEATSSSGATVSYTVTATDAVDPNPTVECDPPSGSTFSLGATAVSCSATDATGNQSTGSFTVTVGDSTDPVVSLSGNVTAEATGELTEVEYLVTATDNVAVTSLTCEDDDATPFATDAGAFPLGETTVTCTATDDAGNTSSGSFTVTVVDTTGPELDLPEGPIVVEATSPAGAEVLYGASATDLVDGTVEISCTPASGTTFPIGTTTVECSAEDAAGNPSSGSFDVVVRDTTPPTLDIPENLTHEATGPAGAPVVYEVTATDAASSPTLACTDASGETVDPNGQVFALGETVVTCVATDGASLTNTGSFTVTVVDTTAPVVNVPADITKEATSADGAVVEFSATTEDLVDGELPAICTPVSGSTFALGSTPVTCEATDDAGNTGIEAFTVTVEDTTAPEVTVPDNIVAEATDPNGAVVTYSGQSALDIVDGAITPICTPTSGSTFALGTHTVTCAATDAAGNTGSKSFTVTVQDTEGPDVTVPEDIRGVEATGPDGAEVPYSGQRAHDAVDGDVDVDCQPPSGATFGLGETTVVCTAVDSTGNEGSNGFVVEVVDTTPPALILPANQTIEAMGPGGAPATWTASATDLVDGNVDVLCDPESASTFVLGENTVECTATDAAGNDAEGSFTIAVVDTTPPAVTVPADITAEATGPDGAAVTYTGVSATDLVDGSLTATCDRISGDSFPMGPTTVTCTATDAGGNTGTNTFTVTVVDGTAPVLSLPGNLTATATSANGAALNYTATATDLVDGAVTPSCSWASGATFPLSTTTVNCSATDSAGNTASGSFTVTVTYAWSGYLQPINPNGSSVFKLGSTVPVKFRLTGASAAITDANAKLHRTAATGAQAGTEQEGTSTNAPDSGNTFRYDAKDDQYIFNLGTKGLSEGVHQLRVDLGDGFGTRTVNITLRK